MQRVIDKKHLIDAGKFILFFLVINALEQLVKNPLESLFINSCHTSAIPYKITFLFVAIPNMAFYVVVGITLSFVFKRNILLWAILYCTLELSRIFVTTSSVFYDPDIYQYLLVYFRYIVIPLAVSFGIWGHRKLLRKNGRRIIGVRS